MLDLKWIRDNPDALDAALARRGREPAAGRILALDREHRALQSAIQDAQARRNALSKEIGVRRGRGEDAAPLMEEVAALKDEVRAGEEALRAREGELYDLLAGLPNVLDPDVPEGADEAANVVLRQWGEPRAFGFQPREHDDVGAGLGMDFARAARISGARFVTLFGPLARLERALQQYMLDLHTREHGYTEVAVPYLVRDGAMFGSGQLPKFAEDSFQTTTGHWLIPTSEVPLANLVADEILDPDDLPLRYTAGTPCFRSEAGAAGKDTKGMIRQHQFSKVELVSVTHPEDSEAELERMTRCAEEVLKRLDLPYQVVLKCAGDTGFAARKSYDLEVWLPGQGRYREISSCSNCGDFQARRMRARFRPADERRTAFVHTLNGSGLAVGRTLVAILENHQEADGSVTVPMALRPYLSGLDRLTPAVTAARG